MTNDQHVAFGRHSGIPECCIAFFNAHPNMGDLNQQRTRRCPEYRGVEYTMCSTCFRGLVKGTVTPATIHVCDPGNPDCRRFLGDDYEERVRKFNVGVIAWMVAQAAP